MSAPILGIGQAFRSFVQDERQSRDFREAAGNASEMFRRIGTPEAEQFANLFLENPRAAFAMGEQVGGLKNLLAMSQEQAARARLTAATATGEPGSPEQLRAVGTAAIAEGDVGSGTNALIASMRQPAQAQVKVVEVGNPDGTFQKVATDAYTGEEIRRLGAPYKKSGQTIHVAGAPPLSSVTSLQANYVKQSSLFTGIARGLDVAREMAQSKNPQADLNLISAVAKAIDPDSVVRGSEVEMRIEYRDIASKLTTLRQKLTGGGLLSEEDRRNLVGALEGELRARSKLQRGVEQNFRNIAKQYDVPEDLIIGDPLDAVLGRAFPVDPNGKKFAPGEGGLPK